MTSSVDPFTYPHDVEAIVESLKLNLDATMKRRVSDAVSMLVENNRAAEDRASSTVGLLPVVTSDPATPVDGQTWVNSTAGKVRARVNGVTVDLN